MRDVQAVNTDPTGPMPPPDSSGRVVLDETKANIALAAFAAFLFSAVSLVSLLYWVESFETGNIPPLTNPVLAFTVKCGVIAILTLPSLFGALLSPPRVSINYAGVTLRRRGVSRTIGWGELTEVSLQQRTSRDRYGSVTSRTYCRLIGNGQRLVLDPIFGVSPIELASYIQTRGQSSAGTSIALTQTPSPIMPQHVRIQLAVLGILGGLAVAMVVLACGVMRHGAVIH